MATFDVLLPVKNGIKYLGEAVDSIRAQTLRDWRLLILDHGSTDGSLELAHDYAHLDSRVEVHHLPHAETFSALLNLGLDRCDCRYVLRQDADDISLPNRMEVLADAYAAHRELAVIGSLGDVIDGSGKRIGAIDMPTGAQGVSAAALFRTPVAHPAASMRLDAMHRAGARYGVDFMRALPGTRRLTVPGLAEDYFLFGQMALLTRCMNLDDKLVLYRWHGTNVGATRYLEQMRMALTISRHLSDSLAAMHGCASVDPAPFCTHGEALFEIENRDDFSAEYWSISRLLRKHMPANEQLDRELAFRHVVAVRRMAPMASRFARFAMHHGTRQTERRAVKSWLLRGLRRRPVLTLPATVQPV